MRKKKDGDLNWIFLDKDEIYYNENKSRSFHEFCELTQYLILEI